mgnify:CR=1 FL=1
MHDKFGIVNFDNEALTEFIYDTTEDAQKALFQIQENYLQKQIKKKDITDYYNMSATGQPPMNPAVTFQAVSVNSRLQKP